MSALVTLKGLVKVPLLCVKSRQHCLKTEWTLEDGFKRFLINPSLPDDKQDIPLRRLKVAILKFSVIYLINNGPVADSGIQWPIPETSG